MLREAVAAGVNHIDTSDFYGPHTVNALLRQVLHPYDGLTLVTKVGGRRGEDKSWLPALSVQELQSAIEDNLRNLKVDAIDVVNLRLWGEDRKPNEESISKRFAALAAMRDAGKIRHLGLSNASRVQVEEALTIAPLVEVQNEYNLAHRADDAFIDWLAEKDIAYVPFFPLGGFSPLQSSELGAVAQELMVTPIQVAIAWLLQRSSNILLIPGTSSVSHLRENLAAADLSLNKDAVGRLDSIGTKA